ncbi:hypothetical protein TR74_13085, partial [Carbonactinospora thermoautotrophica]
EGGPADLPEQARRVRVVDLGQELKLPHRGGYEHFRPTGEHREIEGRRLAVFRWSDRTEIAE